MPALSFAYLSYCHSHASPSFVLFFLFLEKQQHGQVLSESLVETVAHDWADLRNARTLGEEIHATYHREMESTWGPDHITTVPEDYAQHVILGVCIPSLT